MIIRCALLAGVLGLSALSAQVTFERLLHAAEDNANWLTYSGGYRGWRYSSLEQVRRENAARLRIKWVYQMATTQMVETTPLVIDGVM